MGAPNDNVPKQPENPLITKASMLCSEAIGKAEPPSSSWPAAPSNLKAFLAGVRHQLRTPLNHVIGYSEMLQEEMQPEAEPELLKGLEEIRFGGRRLLELICCHFDEDTQDSSRQDPRELLRSLESPVEDIVRSSERLKAQATKTGRSSMLPDLDKIQFAATEWLRQTEGFLEDKRYHEFLTQSGNEVSGQIPGSKLDTSFFFSKSTPRDSAGAVPVTGAVLIVDDDSGNREILSRRLIRQGFTVTTAQSGEEALSLCAESSFDLILLDMVMPGLDGHEVLQRLKCDKPRRHIPVIMISGLDDMDRIATCIEQGAEDFISKPFNPIFLRARIGAVMEKKRLRDQERTHLLQLQEAQDKAERLLLNVLPAPIAHRLKEGEHAIADSFPDVTVLFGDLVDFTTLSMFRVPAEMVNLLNEVFSTFDHLAGKHGLEKIKTIGDAYMAVSGLPTPRPDHAAAAARMALEMQSELTRLNERLGTSIQIRIGLNSGPVIAGIIGTKKFIYDLWGDTVNIASRMESHGAPERIQVTQSTFDQLRDQFKFENRGEIQIKGKGTMVAYWLVSETGK